MITLTDQLQEIPRIHALGNTSPTITMRVNGNKVMLHVNASGIRALGLEPKVSHKVTLLASTAAIAIKPAGADSGRMLRSKGEATAHELLDALPLKDGDTFVMPARAENGMLIADIPGTLHTRMGYARRQARQNGRVTA